MVVIVTIVNYTHTQEADKNLMLAFIQIPHSAALQRIEYHVPCEAIHVMMTLIDEEDEITKWQVHEKYHLSISYHAE